VESIARALLPRTPARPGPFGMVHPSVTGTTIPRSAHLVQSPATRKDAAAFVSIAESRSALLGDVHRQARVPPVFAPSPGARQRTATSSSAARSRVRASSSTSERSRRRRRPNPPVTPLGPGHERLVFRHDQVTPGGFNCDRDDDRLTVVLSGCARERLAANRFRDPAVRSSARARRRPWPLLTLDRRAPRRSGPVRYRCEDPRSRSGPPDERRLEGHVADGPVRYRHSTRLPALGLVGCVDHAWQRRERALRS
jgi:hypothetical protein